MKILITGAAGFIGFHISKKLLETGFEVIGLDNLNDYYDINLKTDRLKILKESESFTFYKKNLEDKTSVDQIFQEHRPHRVIHLAAQASVPLSISDFKQSSTTNILSSICILDFCARKNIPLVYASSSVVN